MPIGRTSPKRIELEQRRNLVLELRKNGATYRDIVQAVREQMGLPTYALSTAYKDVKRALSDIRAENREQAQDLLNLNLARLESMLQKTSLAVASGDLKALDQQLRIIDEELAYLKLLLPNGLPGQLGAGETLELVSEIVWRRSSDDAG